MADCFPPSPINPINDLLMSIFGPNFFPLYNAGFQPTNRPNLINEKLLQMQLPGGGKLKPIGDPVHKHISEMLAPVTGALGSVFAFFGPLFIILDLIRAIIDIICAFFNPVPIIASLIEMFLTVVPPAIALFPPLSSILLALNTIKLIIAIVVALTTAIISIIDLIVENALSIAELINEGNIAAIDAVTTKICVLLETFGNELGAFAPISFILELLDLFMGLGARFFCASDAACCNSESCPPIIMDPPSGNATISFVIPGITLADLMAPINPLQLPNILDPPITLAPEVEIGPISFPPVDLVPIDDAVLEGFVLLQPETTLSISNVSNLADLQNYIVDPEKIPGAASEDDPATIRVRLTNTATNEEVVARAVFASSTELKIRTDAFEAGQSISYAVEPDKISLLKLNLIGLGCEDDIQAAAAGVRTLVDETSVGIQAVSGGSNRSGFEPLTNKMGRPFPRIPDYNECLAAQQADPSISQAQCVQDISSSFIDDLTDYALDLICLGASRTTSEFDTDRLFVSANDEDAATLTMVVRDINSANLLENFLPNVSSPADFGAQFSTSLGVVGPVIFDSAAGIFRASLTSDTAGTAIVRAEFIVNGNVCMVPGVFDGFSIVDKTIEIEFQRPGGSFPRRRRQTPYVQSAGGRRR